jgi:hypothetical protein
VGHDVTALIGEPWDFTSTVGDNVLVGRIVAASAPGEPVEWVLCDVSPFGEGGAMISTVAVVRRNAGEEPIQQLWQHGETRAHLLYDPTGAPLTAARVEDALRTGHGTLKHLIGTLRL